MFFTVYILQLLRQANKHAHCLQLYICISIIPTCFSGQATIISGPLMVILIQIYNCKQCAYLMVCLNNRLRVWGDL
jgi:hypothetical protein